MPTTPTSIFAPDWEQWNRDDHFNKHGADVGTVLGRTPFGKWDYDAASKDTVRTARLFFKAEHWHGSGYEEARAYFLDHHLLQAITNGSVQKFASYYPETFDKSETPASLRAMTEGDKLLKFKTSLTDKERGGIYQNLQKLHGFI